MSDSIKGTRRKEVLELCKSAVLDQFSLALKLKCNESIRFSDGRNLSKVDLILVAIHEDGDFYIYYEELLRCVNKVKLLNGTELVVLAGMAAMAEESDDWVLIGDKMKQDQVVRILDGRSFTKQTAYIEAIKLESGNCDTINALYNTMKEDDSFMLFSPRPHNKAGVKKLYEKCLDYKK